MSELRCAGCGRAKKSIEKCFYCDAYVFNDEIGNINNITTLDDLKDILPLDLEKHYE